MKTNRRFLFEKNKKDANFALTTESLVNIVRPDMKQINGIRP